VRGWNFLGWGCLIIFLGAMFTGSIVLAIVALGDIYGEPLVGAGTTALILTSSLVVGQVLWLRSTRTGRHASSPLSFYPAGFLICSFAGLVIAFIIWQGRTAGPAIFWIAGLLGGLPVLIAITIASTSFAWNRLLSAVVRTKLVEGGVTTLRVLTALARLGIGLMTWTALMAFLGAEKGIEALITFALAVILLATTLAVEIRASNPDRRWASAPPLDICHSFCLTIFVLWTLVQLQLALSPLQRRGYESTQCAEARQTLAATDRAYEAVYRRYDNPDPRLRNRLDEALADVRLHC
jgi:hypothetical protein